MAKVTVASLKEMKRSGEKFACLTAYDSSFAQVLEDAGIEVVLVGDSLGMVIQGNDSTLPVTLNDMIYHCRAVRRGLNNSMLMVDMPFMSYTSVAQALGNASRLMKEGGAQMVKLEGAGKVVEIVAAMSANGIPVCAHLGLQPQSVNKLGGYRVQGRDRHAADQIFGDALELQDAGADMLLLECVPSSLGERVTRTLEIPTIGIGAGPACDAQVLVLYDMLGIPPGKKARFVENFLAESGSIVKAIQAYRDAVKCGAYPGEQHSFE